MTAAVAGFAITVPFIAPFAGVFGFVALSWPLLGTVVAIVAGYIVATEFGKHGFFRGREA